jgi:hypothetical protein
MRLLASMFRGREGVPMLVAWIAGLACLLAVLHRFRLGCDLSDETFSIALPYRFVLGDKPFVDEISIQQTAGLVLLPFVWLYVKLTRGTTGIVFFVRLVHLFFFKGLSAGTVYALARRWLKLRSVAIAVAFVPFAFVPHSIPNVGYNVLGMTLLTAGTFATAAAANEPLRRPRERLLFFAGMAEGFMAFAYPPMAVAPLVATPLVPACLGRERIRGTAAFVLGGLAAVGCLLPGLAWGGIAGVRRSLGWGVHAGQAHDLAHLKLVLASFWAEVPAFAGWAVVALVLAGVLRSRALAIVAVLGTVLAAVSSFRDPALTPVILAAIRIVTYLGLLAPAFVLVARPSWAVVRGSVLVVVPAFAAGAAAAFTSTQGIAAASLGLLPAAVLAVVLSARALEHAKVDPVAAMLPAFALAFVLVVRAYDFVYRDDVLPRLTAEVTSGPFKGIYTTADRAQLFHELEQVTHKFDRADGRILILYENPGLYLFSKMRPSAICVWEVPYADQEGLLSNWQHYPRGSGLVVKVKGSGVGAIDNVLAPPEKKLYETPHLVVYRDG